MGYRLEEVGIHTVVHNRNPTRIDPKIGDDVSPGNSGYRHHRVELTRHAGLHSQEIMPSPNQQAMGKTGLIGEGQAQITGYGVVDGGDQGYPRALDIENPVRQRLVVVDNVEILGPCQQPASRPLPKGPGLYETPCQFTEPFPPRQGVTQQPARAYGLEPVGIQIQTG